MNDKMFDYMVVALLAFAALVFVIVMIRRWLPAQTEAGTGAPRAR